MQGTKLNVTESELRYMYWDEGLSMQQIAERLDCSLPTVSRYMKKIPKRPHTGNHAPRTRMETREESPAVEVAEAPVTKTPVREVKAVEPPQNFRGLNVVSCVLTVKGAICTYEIDTTEKVVTLKDGERQADVTGILDLQGCKALCQELMKIYAILEERA